MYLSLTAPPHRARAAVAVLCALLLAGCAGTAIEGPARAGDTGPAIAEAQRADDPRALLELALVAPPREAARLRLGAALRYAELGDLASVAGLLETLDDGLLDAADHFRRQLLVARIALHHGDVDRAVAIVDALPDAGAAALDAADLEFASRIRAEVFEADGRSLTAARERLFLDGLLDPEARPANRERIWAILVREDTATLAAFTASAGETELRGWLELARIARGIYPTLESQQHDVEQWRLRWPAHPAAEAMPDRLARLPGLIRDRPRHLALLLPMTGPLASAGRAVRDGFMAAHLQALGAGGATPRVTLVDTHELGAANAYLQAVDFGAELVIGPLSKDAVDDLAAMPAFEVPVLALNTTSRPHPWAGSRGLLQFALLPEDDGVQIARRAWEDGGRRALVLMRQATWSERVFDAFAASFRALGGEVVLAMDFASSADIGPAVSGALLIGESEDRARTMERLLATNLVTEPRRRSDIDTVVAIADPESGRTLKPALDYYFAGDLPVYASSHIHDSGTAAASDRPLDGVRFCDMPWRLLPLDARASVEAAWPDRGDGTASFHALGYDAWRLHGQLAALADPTMRFSGVTGELALDPSGRLRRDLQWAVMRDGRALPLPRMARSTARDTGP
ncbi:MAG TPA: penicillin-binding protein activator [Pseudomonadales bacterium]|nr:penicillin-binding protein activator [Pseudomonadales bacterium]